MTVIGPELKATPASPTVIAAQLTESAALMVMAQAVPVAPLASLTWTLKVPAAVGVPLMRPEEERVRPSGSDPEFSVKV